MSDTPLEAQWGPTIKEAKKLKKPGNIQWPGFQSLPTHRKYLKRVLEVMESFTTGELEYLVPGMAGYDWVKQKYGSTGHAVDLPRMKGRVLQKGISTRMFIGILSGEEIILKHSRFKV